MKGPDLPSDAREEALLDAVEALGPAVLRALSAFEQGGLAALRRQRPGPRRAHKLSEEVVDFLESALADTPHLGAGELAAAVQERFGLSIHPRSVQRALVRREKKRR